MPIRGKVEPPPSEPLYFTSLEKLDKWAPLGNYYDGIPKFKPRKQDPESVNKGKLLVCHDYKLGYVESSFARSYTFNFWSSSDILVYFSHNRITIPPCGWISAAHRQGVKVLGTIIVDSNGDEDDCKLLIIGKTPSSKGGQVDQAGTVSPHYARRLAELARDRKFDGYLINVEVPLAGSYAQARALAAWITILQSELMDKVGPHAETHWYDSVVLNGEIRYQNRVNYYNLPFFLSSTAFFSNYWWRNNEPSKTIEYFSTLAPSSPTQNVLGSYTQLFPKTLQQVYIGVDVWGRSCHGGDGFGLYRSIDHILPSGSGLSVALFGPGWTWEKLEEKGPSFTWDKWWEWETSLWVGPATGILGVDIQIPELKLKPNEPPCQHGPFQPISSYIAKKTPPDPADVPFHTTFCPGTGTKWFVEGREVFESANGWTDVDKQTSLGDMLWPRPELSREDGREDEIPSTSTGFNFSDAWNGGSSLSIGMHSPATADQAPVAYWLPIQSLTVTPRREYQASIVCKVTSSELGEPMLFLSLRSLPGSQPCPIDIVDGSFEDTRNGNVWKKLTIDFNVDVATSDNAAEVKVCIGLMISSPKPIDASIILGQLNVSAPFPPSHMDYNVLIPWVDHQPSTTQPNSPFSGTLTWEVSIRFPEMALIDMVQPENPKPAWNTQPTDNWFPSFLYFNIYAQAFVDGHMGNVDQAVWIGTSKAGWSGRQQAFMVFQENLPFLMPVSKIRFYVQGVTDFGEVMKLEKCAFIDVSA